MNSNLLSLMKVDLLETLDVRKFKENKAKSTSFIVFISLIGILFVFLSVIYNLTFTGMFYDLGVPLHYATIFFAAITALLCFTTSVFKCKSIFLGKDYEMLSSMPIKHSTIIAAKILNLYIIELLYSAIILIPNTVITTMFSGDMSYVLTGIIVTIFTPALPMIVSCLFALFMTLLADRFRFGNVITFILYSLMFVAIMFFSFTMNTASIDPTGMIDMVTGFKWINPTLFFIELAYMNNYFYILVFIAINIVLFVLATLFIAIFFKAIYEIINSHKSNIKYVRKSLETQGQLKTLLKTEYKRFFNSKLYFLNSISSGICAIVISGMMSFMFSSNSMIENATDILPFIREYAFVGTLFIVFCIGIATPASSSINIEGPNFWMLKAYPIDYKKLILAKLLLSITILGPCALVASIIMIILIQPTLYSSIIILILPILFVILTSILGLFINLRYYKLKWKSEQEAVKNSVAMVISMFLDWGIVIALAGILVGLSYVNIYLSGILAVVVIALASIVFYYLLMNSCERCIEKIEEF